jgi:hypothetical protein
LSIAEHGGTAGSMQSPSANGKHTGERGAEYSEFGIVMRGDFSKGAWILR